MVIIHALDQIEVRRTARLLRPDHIQRGGDECLNVHWFEGLEDAGTKIEAGRQDYNANRPQRALKGLSPDEYARLTIEPAAESR